MKGAWWACDSGHSIPIADDAPDMFWSPCPQCTDGQHYRIERTVPEDDETRLVERPSATR